jgi:hypothetical protein
VDDFDSKVAGYNEELRSQPPGKFIVISDHDVLVQEGWEYIIEQACRLNDQLGVIVSAECESAAAMTRNESGVVSDDQVRVIS